MTTKATDTSRFRVGWICAVEVEYVVACELLDEEYPTTSSKHNLFTTGRISGHEVVIACLPKGEYGLASAASVAMDMMRSYPSIQFGLMVGIGGGAPTSKNDVRLGDVVVSNPTNDHSGVIHYNYGKALQGGEFIRTGRIDAPPRVIRSAVQNLATTHRRKGHKIDETIQALLSRNPRLRKQYQCPMIDTLFQSDFIHIDSRQTCDDLDCRRQGRVIERPPRDEDEDNPKIHYGLIASADLLMKDAIRRDQLSEDEGVLCFEMEAAGLMNSFPCIVIRGICDYSDSHKNDLWQGYASATAAAYAKELLSIIPAAELEEIETTAQSRAQRDSTHEVPTIISGPVFSGNFSSGENMYNGSAFETRGGNAYF